MPLLMMVKAKWTLFGIEAPQFIWIAAAVLLVGTLWQIARLWWRVSGEKALYRHIMTQLEAIRLEYGVWRQEGLAQAAYDAVVQVFDAHPPLAPAWHNFDMQMLGQSNAEGQPHIDRETGDPTPRIADVGLGRGGDVTVALTGVDAIGSVGSVTPSTAES